MKIGVIVPQGYFGEFEDWQSTQAVERIIEVGKKAEEIGFDSLWLGEHVLSKWSDEAMVFEPLTLMTALASSVPRVDLGFVVLNSTFRNPALTAKAASTLDAISDSRLILGLGAGFKENEIVAFGYPRQELKERMAILSEHFEIISRMTRASEPPVTLHGQHATVESAANSPRTGGRDHIPLLIGGHGPTTLRLAARYCDQLDLDASMQDWLKYRERVHQRCTEIERDPASLMLSTGFNGSWPYKGLRVTGSQRMMRQEDLPAIMNFDFSTIGTRSEELAAFQSLGVQRIEVGVAGLADTDEGLYELVEDCRSVGIDISPPASVSSVDSRSRQGEKAVK